MAPLATTSTSSARTLNLRYSKKHGYVRIARGRSHLVRGNHRECLKRLQASNNTSAPVSASTPASRTAPQPSATPVLPDLIDLDAELEEQDYTFDEEVAPVDETVPAAADALDVPLAEGEQQDGARPLADEVIEAVIEAGPAPQEELIEEEVTEVLLQDIPPTHYLQSAGSWMRHSKLGIALSITTAAVLGGTLAMAAFRTYQKVNSSRAKRKRQVNMNKMLVEELAKYLPDNSQALTPSMAQKLQQQTGFTAVEIFRKYLWFLLRERKFDQQAVDDLVQLRGALQLADIEVAAALKERAERIYEKYGSLMFNTDGMTPEGMQRKTTCRALFQKLLYLTECENLIAPGSEAAENVNLREVFGATEGDVDKLRLVSLVDVDWDVMERLAGSGGEDGEEGGISSSRKD